MSLEKVTKFGLYLVPFIPLLVFESLFFPFITSKNFVFRILIEILVVLWVVLALRDKSFRPRKSPILIASAIFLAVLILATIFGINPYRSFWSNAERMEGLFGLLHIGAFFVLLTSLFKKEVDWVKYFWTTVALSIILSFYGIFQLAGKLEIHQGGVRLDATLGNATYLAIYLIFHIFILGYLFTRYSNWWVRGGILVAGLLEIFIVYHTATRGAILGLIGGALLFAILASLASKGKAKKFAVIFLIVLALMPIGFLLVKDLDFVQKSPVLSRFASISTSETTTQSRFLIWDMAYDAFKERPILGWGPENFIYIFTKEFEPELWRQEPWFDRAHNVFLDWLTSAGILGLLSYLAIFAGATWALWRLWRAQEIKSYVAALFVGLLAAYFFHNLFVFDNLTSYILFASILGFLHFKYVSLGKERSLNNQQPLDASPFWQKVVLGLVITGALYSLWFFNVRPIKAAHNIVESLVMVSSGYNSPNRNLAKALQTLKETIELNTFLTTETREQTTIWAQRIWADPNVSEDLRQAFAEFAIEQMELQVKEQPYDMRAKTFLAGLYTTTGQYGKTVRVAEELISTAPKRQQFHFALAEAYLRSNQIDFAVDSFRTAFELDPSYDEARINLALSLVYNGQIEEAEKLIKEGFGKSIIADERFINAYLFTNNLAKATQVLEGVIGQNPGNAQYHLTLAQFYAQAGRIEDSVREIQETIKLAPNFRERGEELIREVRAGIVEF